MANSHNSSSTITKCGIDSGEFFDSTVYLHVVLIRKQDNHRIRNSIGNHTELTVLRDAVKYMKGCDEKRN